MAREFQALNSICPYYTMYPLRFPLSVLRRNAEPGQWVLDPFCGRGTTNFAARLLGMPSVGIDSNPVAAAVAQAKVADADRESVIAVLTKILREEPIPVDVPDGEFWRLAFHIPTLIDICRVRSALLRSCHTAPRVTLRALVLGALHGPRTKSTAAYLSNQAPRTFAPKPDYAVRFWKARGLLPPAFGLVEVIEHRAKRLLSCLPPCMPGRIILGDSRIPGAFGGAAKFRCVVTSPPYYGMRTYVPDQWLRNWFVGGPAKVEYAQPFQLSHRSPAAFSSDLSRVWGNAAKVCVRGALMVVRVGGIRDRDQDAMALFKASLQGTEWRCVTARPAGDASDGRRQAAQFRRSRGGPLAEYDVYAQFG